MSLDKRDQRKCVPYLEVAAHGILEAGATLEVAVKGHLHFKDLADVAHRQRLLLVDGQSLSRANRVFDLPTIEFMSSESVVVLLREGHQINLLKYAHALDEDLENGLFGTLIKAVIAERNVDSRLESIIKSLLMLVTRC